MVSTDGNSLVHTTHPEVLYTYVFEQCFFACILNKWLNTSYIFKHRRRGGNKKKSPSVYSNWEGKESSNPSILAEWLRILLDSPASSFAQYLDITNKFTYLPLRYISSPRYFISIMCSIYFY